MLISDILEHNARVFPGKEAVVCDGEILTFRQLEKRVSQLSALFRAMGIRKKEPVSVLAHNSPRYVEILFALASIGATVSPLNFLLIAPELKRILDDLEPGILLFEKKFIDTAENIKESCPSLKRIISLDGEVPGFPSLAEVISEEHNEDRNIARPGENDVAMISYAGSVGKNPKGAMLTHGNLMCASYFSALEMNISRRDVYLSTAPLPFLAGTGRMLKFMLPGAKVVIMRNFEPELALRLIEEQGVTQLLLIPQMMSELIGEATKGNYNLSSLKKISYSGVVPVNTSLLLEAMAIFRCDFTQSFAQVESSGVISFLHVNEEMEGEGTSFTRRMASIGKETIGITVKVIDSRGMEVGPDMVGELAVCGPTVMKGYHNDPFLTRETLKNGWLHTGYMASIDEDGYIYVVDRMRDVIIRGGIPIDPDEIEEVLSEHTAISEVTVVGRPDYEWGEVPVAVVVLNEGVSIESDEILRFASRNMAPFKIPVFVEYAEHLPRNSQGKILKAKIKEELKTGGTHTDRFR